MAVLTIGDKHVQVDDTFLKLSPEQQQSQVEEIAKSIGAQEAATNAVLAPVVEPFLTPSPSDISRHGETISQRYAKSKALQDAKDAAFEAQHPVISTGAELGGGVAATLPLAATATGAKLLGLTGSVPGMVTRGALSGGAINAADAAVRGNDPLAAAEAGAAINAVLPVAARGAGKLVRGIRDQFTPPSTVPTRTIDVNGIKVPVSEADVSGDAAQSAEEQIIQRGGRGDEAQKIALEQSGPRCCSGGQGSPSRQ